ncbi:hypothetical protein K5688_001262 [Campylobacter lari]|uniref:hypothetical protein n=1 Tax=Campylobacter lari TaxID=201 RepID=UPI00128135FE|nr:hypothetical protein [Campylobacter lari]EAJ6151281.1 hypothetical protein [Campylobacter lari]EHZ4885751.1 hypothetical protein [Campylobacter lari]MBT0824720.1 hypothetical protein [Campylobacter lari]
MKVLKFINDDTISHIALLLTTLIPAFLISYQSANDGFFNTIAIFIFSYFIGIIITAILMMIVPPIALLLILPTWLIVISLDFILFVILKIYSFKNKTIKNS